MQLGLVAGALAFVYAEVLAFLVRTWWQNDVYSHGFVVPLIALYLVWLRRGQGRRLPLAPSFVWGVPVMLLAGVMLVVGRLTAVMVALQGLSLLVMIAGLVLLMMGTAHLRALWFPVAYLIFMIPVFGEGTDWIHWPFQLLAANIGIGLLQGLGFAAFQDAQYIHLPAVTLEVAEACSGVRYLISVIAIGIPLAYLTQRTWLRGAALLGLAVAVAVFANGFRVALIGVWAYFGGEVAHGPFHVLQAMFVAWIGYLALFAGAWVLGRGSKRPGDLALGE